MLDYWLASRFGRAWLSLHKGLRPRLGDLPSECALVARGEPLPAGRLWRAQDFAVRVWARFGLVVFLPFLPVGIALSALRHVRGLADVLVGSLLGMASLAGTAMAQGGMIRYRSDRTRLYLLRADQEATEKPLPRGSPGCPRRSDFWVMLLIAVVAYAILFYAGSGSDHS